MQPSLQAVRAFEAAARLGSHTQAAIELGLTQSAISHQIRALESCLQQSMFVRSGRRLELTPAGKNYFADITRALSLIKKANLQMIDRGRRRLTISTLPSVAALWLSPRLVEFTNDHPDIDVHVTTSRELCNMVDDGVDLAIRYGLGEWAGYDARFLAHETLIPICSPDFARKHALDLRGSRALKGVSLLRDDLVDDWPLWLTAEGVPADDVVWGTSFNDSLSLYEAARSGAGIALGRSLLVTKMLAEGTLVSPFARSVKSTYSYWVVTHAAQKLRSVVKDMSDWLLSPLVTR